jgi:hypothetical protein
LTKAAARVAYDAPHLGDDAADTLLEYARLIAGTSGADSVTLQASSPDGQRRPFGVDDVRLAPHLRALYACRADFARGSQAVYGVFSVLV